MANADRGQIAAVRCGIGTGARDAKQLGDLFDRDGEAAVIDDAAVAQLWRGDGGSAHLRVLLTQFRVGLNSLGIGKAEREQADPCGLVVRCSATTGGTGYPLVGPVRVTRRVNNDPRGPPASRSALP